MADLFAEFEAFLGDAAAGDGEEKYADPADAEVPATAFMSGKPIMPESEAQKEKKKRKADAKEQLAKKRRREEGAPEIISSAPVRAEPERYVDPALEGQVVLHPRIVPGTGGMVAPQQTNTVLTEEQMETQRKTKEAVRKQRELSLMQNKPGPKKQFLRFAAGKIWEDKTLGDWPDSDHRLFAGDLGNEVNDNTLGKLFAAYPSFARAKVIRDKKSQKSKGYGFVSFLDPVECMQACREINGKYVGNRPIKLRKSDWVNRELKPRKKKHGKTGKHIF